MSTGLHARRATGLTVAGREEIFTRTESVARWWREGRAAYERLREAILLDFLFLTGARCSNEARNNSIRGDGDFLFLFQIFQIFVFIFIVFAVLLCRAVLALFVHIKIRKNVPGTWYVRTYMHAASGLVSWMEHGALHWCYGRGGTLIFHYCVQATRASGSVPHSITQ